MSELIGQFEVYIGGFIVFVMGIIGVYFKGKSTGTTEEKTKNAIQNAQQQVETTKTVAAHETKVVEEVNHAKQETSDLSDADLRKRMRENYTNK